MSAREREREKKKKKERKNFCRLFFSAEWLGCCSAALITPRSAAAAEGRPLLHLGRARAPAADRLREGVSATPAAQASTTYVLELDLFSITARMSFLLFVCVSSAARTTHKCAVVEVLPHPQAAARATAAGPVARASAILSVPASMM